MRLRMLLAVWAVTPPGGALHRMIADIPCFRKGLQAADPHD